MKTQELKQYIDKVLGNSIRCLLPSYWWKRLFNQVADRIEEVEQSTSQLIDSKVEEVKMPIVDSEDELSKLDLPKGSVAAVEKVGEPVVVNIEDCYLSTDAATDWDKYTVIRGFSEKGTPSNAVGQIHLFSDKSMENGLTIACGEGKYLYYKIANGGSYYSSLEEVNEYLASGEYRLVFGYYIENISAYVTLYSAIPQPSLYIKGDSWERLAKESDLGSGDDNVVIIYANEESTRNTNAFNTIIDCYENETPYVAVVKIDEMLYSANITIQKVNDRYGIMAQCINTASNKFYGVLLGLSVETGVGLATLLAESELITIDSELSDTSTNTVQNKAIKAYVDEQIAAIGEGVEFREFYISSDSFANVEGELTEQQKAYNIETVELVKRGKAVVLFGPSGTKLYCCAFGSGAEAGSSSFTFQYAHFYLYSLIVDKDGNVTLEVNYKMWLDSELSETSGNAIQNKVVTAALNEKADKTYVDEKVANVGGSNLKTINGVSLHGEGNIELHMSEIRKKLQDIRMAVLNNEEVLAAALNDINRRLSELENLSNQ